MLNISALPTFALPEFPTPASGGFSDNLRPVGKDSNNIAKLSPDLSLYHLATISTESNILTVPDKISGLALMPAENAFI